MSEFDAFKEFTACDRSHSEFTNFREYTASMPYQTNLLKQRSNDVQSGSQKGFLSNIASQFIFP